MKHHKLIFGLITLPMLFAPISMISCGQTLEEEMKNQLLAANFTLSDEVNGKSIDEISSNDFIATFVPNSKFNVVKEIVNKQSNKIILKVKIIDKASLKETNFKIIEFAVSKGNSNSNNDPEQPVNPETTPNPSNPEQPANPNPKPEPEPEIPTPTPEPSNPEIAELEKMVKLMRNNLRMVSGSEKLFYYAVNNSHEFEYDYRSKKIVSHPAGTKINWRDSSTYSVVLELINDIFPNTNYELANAEQPYYSKGSWNDINKKISFEIVNGNIIFKHKVGLFKGRNVDAIASQSLSTSDLGKLPTIIDNPNVTPEPQPQPEPEPEIPTPTPTPNPDNSSNDNGSLNKHNSIVYNESDNYYSSLNGLSGDALINNLFTIQKKNREHVLGYNDLFETYKYAFVDKYYEKDGSVMDIYGENPKGNDPFVFWHGKYRDVGSREGEGMNREHLVAQSWFGKAAPMRNDAHHVWPTDKVVNARHSNYPFGTVTRATYTSLNGTKVGTSAEDGKPVTEVIDEFKGDVARAFLYVAFTYRDRNLRSNESAQRFFIDSKNTISPAFLKTMLAWHRMDPVDQFDLDRNNGVASRQVVRNPFTDYPELVDVIFGNNANYQFTNRGVALNVVKS
ncbi:Extracellular ribonuclease precursor [Metamycoplasma cloacale]|uniref:Uncharacterized protein n=1 Tax=Metamycoplasma cloacale TaxID=92401 RepID=A0A2Z4LLI2_9BACT|nr:endonuclease [Metamycoplasma cloacale]AWX42629.1 hypothetical protein DK849_00825 [Metamycoplasma cloacale]VEU79604.1 Extracellular ribonuclease precursor [Metamycoplasma cloacale]